MFQPSWRKVLTTLLDQWEWEVGVGVASAGLEAAHSPPGGQNLRHSFHDSGGGATQAM